MIRSWRGSGANKEEGQEAERCRAGKRSQPDLRCDGAIIAHVAPDERTGLAPVSAAS